MLWRLEKGKIKNIKPNHLRAVAELYELPYDELVAKWTAHQFGTAAPTDASSDRERLDVEAKVSALAARLKEVLALATCVTRAAGDDETGELLDLWRELGPERRHAAVGSLRDLAEAERVESGRPAAPARKARRARETARGHREAS